MPGRYEIVGRGSDLGIHLAGTALADCLSAAVAALAASLAEVTGDVPRQYDEVVVEGDSAEDLLVGLLDEVILRLDVEGRLAVSLTVSEAAATRVAGQLELVDLDAVDVHGVAPKAATWHGVRLGPGPSGWEGEVMLDL